MPERIPKCRTFRTSPRSTLNVKAQTQQPKCRGTWRCAVVLELRSICSCSLTWGKSGRALTSKGRASEEEHWKPPELFRHFSSITRKRVTSICRTSCVGAATYHSSLHRSSPCSLGPRAAQWHFYSSPRSSPVLGQSTPVEPSLAQQADGTGEQCMVATSDDTVETV